MKDERLKRAIYEKSRIALQMWNNRKGNIINPIMSVGSEEQATLLLAYKEIYESYMKVVFFYKGLELDDRDCCVDAIHNFQDLMKRAGIDDE